MNSTFLLLQSLADGSPGDSWESLSFTLANFNRKTGSCQFFAHGHSPLSLFHKHQLMNMMRFAEQYKDDDKYCIAWIPDGKSFIVRNPEIFTRQVLPKFFK